MEVWGVEVWLASAHSKEKVQLTDLREFVIKDWSSRSASCTAL